ncbi:MAG TPA: AAA family ATPase, partial [Catalimonadaceae bacterium]|nr:AAA family ATPase [Catalimonadaceae bacterium]
RITLPDLANLGKDISDFFATGGKVEGLENLVKEKEPLTISLDHQEIRERNSYNAVELLSLGNTKPQYLLEPLFPQKGTAVIAGKPDTGKSQFARQLCIQVALGMPDFLGFSLNLINKSAVYVATEDSMEATTFLLKTQLEGLQETAKENLRFIFADTMEQDEILENLEAELKKAPADLVVVDSFGDIFKGGDSNNNMAMRNTVKAFDKIAKQQSCLILFVHHINKGAYRLTPGQEHIQGGAGLVQKVRLAIQLSEGEGPIRYFTVVKGNYCPKEYKANTLELEFSEKTFLFSFSGKMLPTSEIGMKPEGMEKETKMSELERVADEIFGSKVLNYAQFVKEYCIYSGKSIPTAKRLHRDLKKLEIIIECQGGYRQAAFASSDEEVEEDDDF